MKRAVDIPQGAQRRGGRDRAAAISPDDLPVGYVPIYQEGGALHGAVHVNAIAAIRADPNNADRTFLKLHSDAGNVWGISTAAPLADVFTDVNDAIDTLTPLE